MDISKIYLVITVVLGTKSEKVLDDLKSRIPDVIRRNTVEVLTNLDKRVFYSTILITIEDALHIGEIGLITDKVEHAPNVSKVVVYGVV